MPTTEQEIKELKKEVKKLKQTLVLIEELFRKQQWELADNERDINEHRNDPMGHKY